MTKKQKSEKIKSSKNSGLGKVVVRNEFYRDGYRMLLRVALAQGAAIIILIAAMFFVISANKTQYEYFATNQSGSLIPMVPLSEPNLSDAALLSWVSQAVTESLTFGFNDYRRRLQEASRHFTSDGWSEFTKALQRSEIIDRLEANNQVLTAIPEQAPVIVSHGVSNGKYRWVIQMPVVLTYKSGNSSDTRKLIVTLNVVRLSQLESPYGVGIQQWLSQ